MTSVKEMRDWLNNLDEDDTIAIDHHDPFLVSLKNKETFIEIGRIPGFRGRMLIGDIDQYISIVDSVNPYYVEFYSLPWGWRVSPKESARFLLTNGRLITDMLKGVLTDDHVIFR